MASLFQTLLALNPTKPISLSHLPSLTRRSIATGGISMASLLLPAERGRALDLRMVAPDQTVEEAESGIGEHARRLLGVKALLEVSPAPESWKEAQRELRRSAAALKQDVYTLIQSRPSAERPRLRRLYSALFNGVSSLDYAAREGDEARVWECYGNVVAVLDEILSSLLS